MFFSGATDEEGQLEESGAAFTSTTMSSGTITPGLLIKIHPAQIALSIALSRWALKIAEASSAALTVSRVASSSWTTDLLEVRRSLMIESLIDTNYLRRIIQRLLQPVTMIIQVLHGETMAPFQDSQRVAGIAIQPVKVVTRSCKGTIFLLRTRIGSPTSSKH
jgi:hypothetical protein